MANKTYGELQYDFNKEYERHKINNKSDVETALKRATEKIQAELTEYYSTPKGKEEIEKSYYRGYSVESAVELLMRDVRAQGGKLRKIERLHGKGK